MTMTDHLRRFREYMNVEARFLAAAADRARILDHRGNRGSDAEQSVIRWLRDRLEPEYAVSSGEVVDSFQTNVERDSRQHDAIVHENTRFARRFSLQSGLRLVPIETVALVIEIKLDVDGTKFKEADDAATETAKLRLAVDEVQLTAGMGGPVTERHASGPEDGLPTSSLQLAGRVHFALFAFNGPKQVETLAPWLEAAETISSVCCLDTGCAYRSPGASTVHCELSTPELALVHFAELVDGTISQFERSAKCWRPRLGSYSARRDPTSRYLKFWDQTGYAPPPGYHPGDNEVAELVRLGKVPPGWKYTPP